MTIADLKPTSVFADRRDYVVYDVELAFTGKLVGGNPADPKLVEGWLTKNLGIEDDEQLRQWTMRHLAEVHGLDPTEATPADIDAAIEANAKEKQAQVFKRLPTGEPYVEPRHVKAMLKEATNIAYPKIENKWGQRPGKTEKYIGKMVGGKDPVDYLAERVFVVDEPIVVADEVAGVELAVGHIKDDRTGEKRSTIGYFEYCDLATITFQVQVLDDCIDPEKWARIWTVAELNGLGARRSQGCGQFVVTRWDQV